MITIKCGKLFVEKYNEMKKTNLTPKEVFCMLAEKAFKGGRHMVNWTNSKFFSYLKEYNKFLDGKKEEPSFEDALNSFCDTIENLDFGIETSMNVYGGCAMKGNDGFVMATTEFNYCDNLHFTIDERYYSFIGSFFQICVNGFSTTIDDKDIVWMMYESFNKYYSFIHKNDDVRDKQLPAWNGCYFYEAVMGKKGYTTSVKLSKDGFSTISFLEFLEAISKLTDKKVDVLTFENFGQYNVTCGYITIDLDGLSGWFKIFRNVLTNIDEDFDIKKYADVFGKKNLLFTAMEYGEITKDMLNPLYDFKKRKALGEFKDKSGIKFLKKYLELIMTKQEIDMAKAFAKFLTEASKSGKKTLSMKAELNDVFASTNATRFTENVMTFCKKSAAPKEEVADVVTYFMENGNQTKLREFLVFTKFNI